MEKLLKILKIIFGNLFFISAFMGYVLYGYFVIIRMRMIRKKYGFEESMKYALPRIRNFGQRAFRWTFSKVKVLRKADLPKSPYIIVSNHQSLLDIPLILGYVDPSILFVAKEEVRRIPMIGAFVKEMGGVFIDRKNTVNAAKALKSVVERIEEGRNVVIFPEGTRSYNGELGEFKKGSLKIAMRTGAKIVPVALNGTFKITPKGSIFVRPGKVKLMVGDPMDPEGFKTEEELRNAVRERIQSLLFSMRGGDEDGETQVGEDKSFAHG